MAIYKPGLGGLPRSSTREAGLRWEEFKFEPKDMPALMKWTKKKFLCWYCKVQPIPHTARVTEFQLEKDAELSYAADVIYCCPKCGLQFIFGIPITREEYESTKLVGTEVVYA